MIENEKIQFSINKPQIDGIKAETVVGKLLSGLSHKTKPSSIEALASITDYEIAKIYELDRILKESNPKDKANQLNLMSSRMAKISAASIKKQIAVNDEKVERLRSLTQSYKVFNDAAIIAANILQEDKTLLPGTGGDSWKELFKAARRFLQEADSKASFSSLSPDSLCPLCQQPLSSVYDQIIQFDRYLEEEAGKKADEAKASIDAEMKSLAEHDLSIVMDDELFQEVSSLDKELATDIRSCEVALLSRKETIVSAVASGNFGEVLPLPPNPVRRINTLVEALRLEANVLEQAANDEKRAELQKELDEFDARIKLASNKVLILNVINRMIIQSKLDKCLESVKTTKISNKASELAERVVSKTLEDALNEEYKAIGIKGLRVCLKTRAVKGKALHKLSLDMPQSKIPGEILSEGEQRAIAIASFLAEIQIGGSSGGIIFDDPVSSLDHKRRERVARRLAHESAKRQVIVFTHDIYFLSLLAEEAKRIGIHVTTKSLIKKPEGFGITDNDLPFEGMSTKDRVGFLRQRLVLINKHHKLGDEVEFSKSTAEAYSLLRIAWERAVEEVLLCNVVLRFRKGIETQRLVNVSVEDTDFILIDKYMSKCSHYALDQALLGGTDVPDPDELLGDINALGEWCINVRKRNDITKENRNTKILPKL